MELSSVGQGDDHTDQHYSDLKNETRDEQFNASGCLQCLNPASKDRGSGAYRAGCERTTFEAKPLISALEWRSYQATHNANSLIESTFPDIFPGEEEINLARQSRSKLSEKDHWENNGILDYLPEWPDSKVPSLLWIGGQSGNQDPWITEFSADVVSALSSQDTNGVQVHVFLQSGQTRTQAAVDILRTLIARFIEKRPTLLMKLPEFLNSRTLRRTESLSQTWGILERIVDQLEATFIIIDRLDLGHTDVDDVSAAEQLLPKLLGLAELGSEKVKIIVTSIQEPPLKWQNDTRLSSVWLDTGTRRVQRDRR